MTNFATALLVLTTVAVVLLPVALSQEGLEFCDAEVFVCVGTFVPQLPDYDEYAQTGFVDVGGFVGVGDGPGERRRRRALARADRSRNLQLEFVDEWFDGYEDFVSDWMDVWYNNDLPFDPTGEVIVYESSSSDDAGRRRQLQNATGGDPTPNYAIAFDLSGLPETCETCQFAVTDATECTVEAVTGSGGVSVRAPTDGNGVTTGTVTFSKDLEDKMGPGFFVGKTVLYGYGNGTAIACGTIKTSSSSESDNTGGSSSSDAASAMSSLGVMFGWAVTVAAMFVVC